jgi:hypothetical protein
MYNNRPVSAAAGSPDFRAFPVKPAGERRCPNAQRFG